MDRLSRYYENKPTDLTDLSYTKNELGKINSVKFGLIDDRDFLMGLVLDFRFGSCCGVGDSICVNIGRDCRWEEGEREKTITAIFEIINNIMVAAQVTNIMDLKDKPVELYSHGMLLVGWRILKEVL